MPHSISYRAKYFTSENEAINFRHSLLTTSYTNISQSFWNGPTMAGVVPLLCRYWAQGHCSRGEGCWYVHAKHEEAEGTGNHINASSPSSTTRAAPSQKQAIEDCRFFSMNRCNKGERCPFLHDAPGNTVMESSLSNGKARTSGGVEEVS